MAVTHETGLSPQAPPQGQDPSSREKSPQQVNETSEQNESSAVAGEKRELLEIAKANAAKTFGTDTTLPASLRISTKLKGNEIGSQKTTA